MELLEQSLVHGKHSIDIRFYCYYYYYYCYYYYCIMLHLF